MNNRDFKEKYGVSIDTLMILRDNIEEDFRLHKTSMTVQDFIVLNDFKDFLNKLINHVNKKN